MTRYGNVNSSGSQSIALRGIPRPDGVAFSGAYLESETEGTRGPLALTSHAFNRMEDPCMRARFEVLAEWWHADTDALSNPRRKIAHRAYRRIIELGNDVVPYILEDLRDNGGDWFVALETITNVQPVPEALYDNYHAVKEAWLHWGRQQEQLA